MEIQGWLVRLIVLLWLTLSGPLTIYLHPILKNKQGSKNSIWPIWNWLKRTILKILKRKLTGEFSLSGCLSNGDMHKSAFGSFFFSFMLVPWNSKWSLMKLSDGKQDWGIDWIMRRAGYWFKIITWKTKTMPAVYIWRNSQMWWHVGVVPKKWFW